MSTNRKNRSDPSTVLRNQLVSGKIPKRYMLNLRYSIDTSTLKKINDSINNVIQQLNLHIESRNIPYLRLEVSSNKNDVDKTRVVLRTEQTPSKMLSSIEISQCESEDNTYLVELYLNDNGYIEIGCAPNYNMEKERFDGRILVDQEFIACIFVDIFVDSSLFNSYSFLKHLSVQEKRDFNKKKIAYLKKNFGSFEALNHPFYKFNHDNYKYLSMAFFARKNESEIDYDKLIFLWDNLVSEYYPNEKHREPPIDDQLAMHFDHKQLPSYVSTSLASAPLGTYWVIRIIQEIRSEPKISRIVSIFGNCSVGTVKIINFSDIKTCIDLVEEKYLSAIKVIHQ